MGLLPTSGTDAGDAAKVSAGGNLLGSGLQLAGQALLNRQSYNLSKKLYDYQTDYKKLFDKMIAAGISPAAAAQGLSGATPSMAGMSAGAAPNMSSLGYDAVQASRTPSEIQSNIADAEFKDEEKSWLSPKYQAMIDETMSRIAKNNSEIQNNVVLRNLYRQQIKDLKLMRPYKLQKASQEIQNLMAEYNVLTSQRVLNFANSSNLNADTGNKQKEGKIKDVQLWQQRWYSSWMRAGFDPHSSAMENLYRVSIIRPDLFKSYMGAFNASLTELDAKLKSMLGDDYKWQALKYASAKAGIKMLGELGSAAAPFAK